MLSRHEAVRQCVVVTRADVPGENTLVAYFEPQGGIEPYRQRAPGAPEEGIARLHDPVGFRCDGEVSADA